MEETFFKTALTQILRISSNIYKVWGKSIWIVQAYVSQPKSLQIVTIKSLW